MAGHQPKGVTRPHTLGEIFSTLTGRGIETPNGKTRLHPDDATALLTDLSTLTFVELTAKETLKAIQEAGAQGIRGGLIHDWLLVQAAHKAKADAIVTENTQRLRTLTKTPLKTFAGQSVR